MACSAVILPDYTIAGVLMADATVDTIPQGYPEGSFFVVAPQGCDEDWTYTPDGGFEPPKTVKTNKIDF